MSIEHTTPIITDVLKTECFSNSSDALTYVSNLQKEINSSTCGKNEKLDIEITGPYPDKSRKWKIEKIVIRQYPTDSLEEMVRK